MTVINFQQALQSAQTASFEPLPDGTYDMVVVESTPTTSSTQKPMIKVKYRVETGPSAGKTVFNNYTFSDDNPTALAIFFRHMAFHGLDANFFTQNPAWETVASTLLNRRVRVELGTRMWQGEPRNDVKRISPPDAQAAGQVPAGVPGPTAPVAAPAAIMPPAQFQTTAQLTAPPVAPPTMVPAPTPPVMQPQAPVGPPPTPAAPITPAPVATPAAPAAPPGWQLVNGQWVPEAQAPAPAPAAPQSPVAPPPQPFEQPYQTDAGAVPPPPPVPT